MDRFENFKHQRAVFIFEHTVSNDWIGIMICDGNMLPVNDPEIVRYILNYRGDLKCDIRVESRNAEGSIEKLYGFEWDQVRCIDSTPSYRFHYDARERVLDADGHLWKITTHDRGSVINSLYALAVKHRLPITGVAVRLAYKSLKLVDKVTKCQLALVDKATNIVYRINQIDGVCEGIPVALPDQFCIINPYKNVYICARNGCAFEAWSLCGESYTIPDYLIPQFITHCAICV